MMIFLTKRPVDLKSPSTMETFGKLIAILVRHPIFNWA